MTEQIAQLYLEGAPHVTNRIGWHSNYSLTLERLFAHVEKKRLFIVFYEELGHEAQIRRLCGFLGLSFQSAKAETVIGAGKHSAMPDWIRQEATLRFRPQYEAVRAAAAGPVPAKWDAVFRP